MIGVEPRSISRSLPVVIVVQIPSPGPRFISPELLVEQAGEVIVGVNVGVSTGVKVWLGVGVSLGVKVWLGVGVSVGVCVSMGVKVELAVGKSVGV